MEAIRESLSPRYNDKPGSFWWCKPEAKQAI